ncbi:Clp protease [Rhizobium albus]|nr:Clp protease [Rhizobium albus]
MDQSGIADRRRLRRKLTFWRIVGLLAVVLLVVGLTYAGGFAERGEKARSHIARVMVSGVITANEDLLERLEDVRDDPNVRAVVIGIESPGGTTYGGEVLYKAVRDISAVKPVVAEVRGLAASAGYMIASATDHIVAGEASIVGSIGVIFQYGNISELLDNIGVSVGAVKSSPLKAEPSPFSPANPEAEEMIGRLVADSYDWFVDLVAERRNMSRPETLAIADGSIFTGRQALQNGLVDAIGAEDEVRAYLGTRDIDTNLDIVDWEPERSRGLLFGQAAAGLIGGMFGNSALGSQVLSAFTDQKLFLDGLISVWQFGGQQARDDWGNTP